jgi:hypothetical protein
MESTLIIMIRGCGLLSHLHFWHPEKLKAVAFLSVGYTEISDKPLDLGLFSLPYQVD